MIMMKGDFFWSEERRREKRGGEHADMLSFYTRQGYFLF